MMVWGDPPQLRFDVGWQQKGSRRVPAKPMQARPAARWQPPAKRHAPPVAANGDGLWCRSAAVQRQQQPQQQYQVQPQRQYQQQPQQRYQRQYQQQQDDQPPDEIVSDSEGPRAGPVHQWQQQQDDQPPDEIVSASQDTPASAGQDWADQDMAQVEHAELNQGDLQQAQRNPTAEQQQHKLFSERLRDEILQKLAEQ